jgi:maltose/moltooligosaccharide transporter
MSSVSLTSEKPRLSFWQIWNMSFGFLGIQFGFALQNANTSRIFETLGADKENLAILWLAAPVAGLLVQPIIGYYSDRTWHPKWGRRRPYFAIGAILATIALCIMPNSPVLWIAVGCLWIMDASINISMEPFRAFVGDMLPNEQRTQGFATQSFFIGIGAVVASALPYILTNLLGVPNDDPEGGIPPSVKWSFYIGAFAFFAAVMWTVFTTKEYPPAEEELEGNDKTAEAPLKIRYSPNTYLKIGVALLALSAALIIWFSSTGLDKKLYVLCGIFSLFGFSYLGAALLMKKGEYRIGFVQIVRDFQNMPRTMIELAFVQFFSWFALFAMWIYTTSGITSHTYDMKLFPIEVAYFKNVLTYNEVPEDSKTQQVKDELSKHSGEIVKGGTHAVVSYKLVKYFLDHRDELPLLPERVEKLEHIQDQYNEGANWVGILFAMYNGFAALAAIFLPFIVRVTSRKVTHMIMLIIGGVGLISFYFIPDPNLLLVSMVGVGCAWASILAIPYAMLSSSLPAEKMGYYMGIFNFFIVIPQIVAASILGFLVIRFFNGEFIYALVIGGASMILAGLLSLRVHDHEEVEVKKQLDT